MFFIYLGDLLTVIRRTEAKLSLLRDKLPKEDYLIQIANGMAYLADRNIIHRALVCCLALCQVLGFSMLKYMVKTK